jgi:hypothetical protein
VALFVYFSDVWSVKIFFVAPVAASPAFLGGTRPADFPVWTYGVKVVKKVYKLPSEIAAEVSISTHCWFHSNHRVFNPHPLLCFFHHLLCPGRRKT